MLNLSFFAGSAGAFVTLAGVHAAVQGEYPIQPVPFTDVSISGGFWGPRMETNRQVTIPATFRQSEVTGRIANFAKAGGLQDGPHEGARYNDSDVFKIIEGACYSLQIHPDPELEATLDDLIANIAAAQEEDGYLFTARTIDPNNLPPHSGDARWSFVAQSHELYNVGHLYEAAVAHYLATGKRALLDVALKNAELIGREFGPHARREPPGHQEIEIGLVKLYRVTGERKYLELARFFLDQRGRPNGRELRGEYQQDHKPVVEQREAVGHAVRATYMYSGMADVAAITGDQQYITAIDALWDNVVSRKLSITGGIGASRAGEAFGGDYELPNAEAYNETCAAIGNAMWNHRLFLLQGDAKYIDVLERILYNGFLSGVSLDGDEFFYPNPLASDGRARFNHGQPHRSPWFGTACCPVNVVRFMPSIAGYVYARRGDQAYVNLFINGTGTILLETGRVLVTQETQYPWHGKVKITVTPDQEGEFAINLRIPGWARGEVVPGDLYRFLDDESEPPRIHINGEAVEVSLSDGYARLLRTWRAGDVIELELPMPVRRVVAHENVGANRGRVAFERGPIVYAFEGTDNAGQVLDLAIADDVEFAAEFKPGLLGGVMVLQGTAQSRRRLENGGVVTGSRPVTAIPYYAWAHRGATEMQVWMPRSVEKVELPPPPKPPTIASTARASASHVFSLDTVEALGDQIEPSSSGDHDIPRFTWWPRRGSSEWVQYEFDRPTELSRASVYWFDDSGAGFCRVPASWRLLYHDGEQWKPLSGVEEYSTRKDQFNVVNFQPVTTAALRLEVQLQDGYSAGILEWVVD